MLCVFTLPTYGQGQGRNLTPTYKALVPDDHLNRKNLENYEILFVSGFFAKYVDFFRGYYLDQIQVLKNYSLTENKDFKKIQTDTEQPISDNANVIYEMILKSTKPVIIVSHSKGSAEVLEALTLNPQIQNQVYAWINIQGAIGGSFIADAITCEETNNCPDKDLLPPPAASWAQSLLQNFFGSYIYFTAGTEQGLFDLQQNYRLDFMKNNKNKILQLQQNLKVLSVVTFEDYNKLPLNYRLGQKYLSLPKKRNDGLIYTESQILPNSPYIILKTHHNGLVAPGERDRSKQPLFFEKILNLLWSL